MISMLQQEKQQSKRLFLDLIMIDCYKICELFKS